MEGSEDHGWHLFDEQRGYEVARSGDTYYVRRRDEEGSGEGGSVREMTADEFDAWRSADQPNPEGLE